MILTLAYGNSLRRDDGAGFFLADVLGRLLTGAGARVERIDSHQLEPEFALDIAAENVSAVVFLDTRVAGGSSEGFKLRVERIYPVDTVSPGVGHNLDAALLLAYAKSLFKREPPAWLVTVPGVDFGHGEGFSGAVRKLLEGAEESLREFAASLVPYG